MTKATVLVPTHDHGQTLLFSIQSVLAQTVEDFEVLIVGDGVPEVTRGIASDFIRRDRRVRFFDNPKGPRHGELHRGAALQEATGDIVCYLADDDLWLPTHLETMAGLLADADFAHVLPLSIDPSGVVAGWTIDFTFPYYRHLLLSGSNRIPLSCGGHTMRKYRSLPHGWRTTPDDTYTDLYMWQQFLADPNCRPRSGHQPTVLHFPSPWRSTWSDEQRIVELAHWSQKLSDHAWLDAWQIEVLGFVGTDRAALETGKEGVLAELIERNRLSVAENLELQLELAQEAQKREALEGEAASLRAEIEAIHNLPTWRLRNAIASRPFGAAILRLAGKVLAGPTAR